MPLQHLLQALMGLVFLLAAPLADARGRAATRAFAAVPARHLGHGLPSSSL